MAKAKALVDFGDTDLLEQLADRREELFNLRFQFATSQLDNPRRIKQVRHDVARILRPGGRLIITFSNRCFPTKAIRGWLATDDAGHRRIVSTYFELTERFGEPVIDVRIAPRPGVDPLYAVWASLD